MQTLEEIQPGCSARIYNYTSLCDRDCKGIENVKFDEFVPYNGNDFDKDACLTCTETAENKFCVARGLEKRQTLQVRNSYKKNTN